MSHSGDSGFRIGFGYHPQDCCAALAVHWTYFKPEDKRTVKNPNFDENGINVMVPYTGLGLINDFTIAQFLAIPPDSDELPTPG